MYAVTLVMLDHNTDTFVLAASTIVDHVFLVDHGVSFIDKVLYLTPFQSWRRSCA